jgi:hypothetical protein
MGIHDGNSRESSLHEVKYGMHFGLVRNNMRLSVSLWKLKIQV